MSFIFTDDALKTIDVDESELIRCCVRGEAAAWEAVFERHYAAVGRFVFQVSPSFTREDAEEITQEVFLSAIRSIDKFKGGCQLQTWLFRIALNKARDWAGRNFAQKRGGGVAGISLDGEAGEGLRNSLASPAPSADRLLETAERHQMLHAALERVGEPCREVVELRYFGDLSYEELAGTLGLNPKTVSSRLSKCLDRLEEILLGLRRREESGGKIV